MSEAFVPLPFDRISLEESRARGAARRDLLRRRRRVRRSSPVIGRKPLDEVRTIV